MSEYIYYQCPSCSKLYRTLSKNAGQKRTCTDCFYVNTAPLSSTFAPNQQQQQQPKLIDCPDCGTSISRLAAACPKCGRAGQAALEQGKYTKGIYLVICMVVSWLIVQYFASFRVEKFQRMEDESRRKYERLLNP